jgi:hypothetical protein
VTVVVDPEAVFRTRWVVVQSHVRAVVEVDPSILEEVALSILGVDLACGVEVL